MAMKVLVAMIATMIPASAVMVSESQVLSGGVDQNVTKFVTATFQRSGSSWLSRMLNFHPDVTNLHDLNCMISVKNTAETKGSPQAQRFLKKIDGLRPDAFMKWFSDNFPEIMDVMLETPTEHKNLSAYGFKWMIQDGMLSRTDEAIKYLNQNNIRVIVLVRENALRQAISSYKLFCEKDSAGYASTDGKVKQLKSDVSVGYFTRFFQRHHDYVQILNKVFQGADHAMYIKYEDLAVKPDQYLDRIQEFLGVRHQTNEILAADNFQKMHLGSIDDLVSDWSSKKEKLLAANPHLTAEIEKWDSVDPYSQLAIEDSKSPSPHFKYMQSMYKKSESFAAISHGICD